MPLRIRSAIRRTSSRVFDPRGAAATASSNSVTAAHSSAGHPSGVQAGQVASWCARMTRRAAFRMSDGDGRSPGMSAQHVEADHQLEQGACGSTDDHEQVGWS
ncbi:hypothetical protein C6W10_10190 [Plantactinospora sp. BB1]|nr:hypothetical protein C6W10_10190 [Plantactinospora sp. BB1]